MSHIGAVHKLGPVVVDVSNEHSDEHGAGQRLSGMFIAAHHRQPVNGDCLSVQDIGCKQLSRCFLNGKRYIGVIQEIPEGK